MGRRRGEAEEDSHPADTGCSYYPSCLECPLPVCRYDMGVKVSCRGLRNREIRQLASEGLSTEELVHRFSMSERSIVRIVKGY